MMRMNMLQFWLALSNNLAAVVSQRLIPRIKKGVVPALEILFNTPTVKDLLESGKINKLEAAIAGSRDDGMQSFNQALLDFVNNGEISEKEALKYATNKEALKMNLKGVFLGTDSKILG